MRIQCNGGNNDDNTDNAVVRGFAFASHLY